MPAPIVFFDIAGPDLASQRSFYQTVFGWGSADHGGISVPLNRASIDGNLRADSPEKVLYVGVDDVTAVLAEIERNGGQTVAPRFEVPGVVVLGLFADPAGNRMGLVEMDGNRPKVP